MFFIFGIMFLMFLLCSFFAHYLKDYVLEGMFAKWSAYIFIATFMYYLGLSIYQFSLQMC